LGEGFTPMNNAVANAGQFGHIAKRPGFFENGVDQIKPLPVIGNGGFFFDLFEAVAVDEGLVGQAAVGLADFFQQAGRQDGPIPHIKNLVFDRRTAGIDDHDFH
jgi:hypothetical protein